MQIIPMILSMHVEEQLIRSCFYKCARAVNGRYHRRAVQVVDSQLFVLISKTIRFLR